MIKLLVDGGKSSVIVQTAYMLKELVSTRILQDELKVEVKTLGDRDLFEELRTNQAQIIAPKISRLKRYIKRLQVFELTFIFYSDVAAENFLEGEWENRLLNLLNRLDVNAHGYIHKEVNHLGFLSNFARASQR